MGKLRKIIGFVLVMTAFYTGTAFAEEAELKQERRIEQVYLNLPEVYVYGEGFALEEAKSGEGYLSQDKLTFHDVQPFGETGEGIAYYLLLDVSASVPNNYFSSIKEGILRLQDSLNEQDRLILCTFGDKVTLAADGSQTSSELAKVLSAVKNSDQTTLLFEGIDNIANLASQNRNSQCPRQVLIVISDGEDFAVGKKMAQEALTTLKEKGFPVYAVCISDTDTVNINSFGEFARTSGGKLTTFQAKEGSEVLLNIKKELDEMLCIRYQAASNVVSNKEENFSLQFSNGSVLSKAVMNVYWIPDQEPPYFVSGEAVGNQQIQLTFSEPMMNLAETANYRVTFGEREKEISGITYDGKDAKKVILTLKEPLQNGTYQIEGMNLTDCSMEKNPLEGRILIEVSGMKKGRQTETEDTDYRGVLSLIVLTLTALTIAVIVLIRQKRKPDSSDRSSYAHAHQYIDVPKKTLAVEILSDGRMSQQAVWEITDRLVVGRSNDCDVVINDRRLSRQHFCLEWKNEQLFLFDLNSTNGTKVNGLPVQEKRVLNKGERIKAGSMEFRIRW